MSRINSPRQRSTAALDQIRGFPSIASPPRINTSSLNPLVPRPPINTRTGGASLRQTLPQFTRPVQPVIRTEQAPETTISTQTVVTSSSRTPPVSTVTTISDGQNETIVIAPSEEESVTEDLPGSVLMTRDRTEPVLQQRKKDAYYERLHTFLSSNQEVISTEYSTLWSNKVAIRTLEHVATALESKPTFILNEEGGIAIWYQPTHNNIKYSMVTIKDTDHISELPYLHFPVLNVTLHRRLKKETIDALPTITSLISYQDTTQEITVCADRLSVALTTLDVILEYDQGWLSAEQAKEKIYRRCREIVTGKIQSDLELVRYFEGRISQ
jgi:hypothetical protein